MNLTIKNLSLNYEIVGEGRPVIILHGFSPDLRLMKGCMEPLFLKKDNFKRIYLDLPGMGKSESPDWINNSDDMLEIVLEFIEEVIPGKNFLLVGESYGGYLASGIIYRMPERVDGLFMICPVTVAKVKDRTVPKHTILIKDDKLLSELTPDEADDFNSIAVVQGQNIYDRYKEEIVCGLKIADPGLLQRIRNSNFEFSFDKELKNITFHNPTLILSGRQDASVGYVDSFNILQNYPRATYAVLDRAGHNLHIEQAGLFNSLADEWLFRVNEMLN